MPRRTLSTPPIRRRHLVRTTHTRVVRQEGRSRAVQHEADRARDASASAPGTPRPAASRGPHADAEDDLAALNRDSPGWRVWLSDQGHWYATRRQDVPPVAGLRYGCVRMVDGPDAVRLLA